MSPEQCRGERNLTHKSDLYSLGVMLYELVTGQKPFVADTPMDIFLMHVQGKFERPSRRVLEIPVWLDNLICQLLEKKPEQRPVDAAMVAQALDQVKEKVETLKSAGVDAVQARRIDRPRARAEADELDREAARALQTGLGKLKVKRRRKRRSVFENKGLQAAGLLFLLVLAVGAIWWLTRPPNADKLYAQAKTLMESSNPEDWERARSGPIQDFLDHYPARDDQQARQVRIWADQEDVRLREQQLYNRRSRPTEDPAERMARKALDREEVGDLDETRKNWQEVRKGKEQGDSDQRIWGLLADKKLAELDKVYERDRQLRDQVERARKQGELYQPAGETERQAALASHFELFDDAGNADSYWRAIREQFKSDDSQRVWKLLADKHLYDLRRQVGTQEENKKKLRKRVEEKLAAAQNAAPAVVKRNCKEIINLYDQDPSLKDLVAQARELLKNFEQ
jgi:serine/threonine-protein kinase